MMFDNIAQAFAQIATGFAAKFGGPYVSARIMDVGAVQFDTGGSIIADTGQPSVRDCMASVDVASFAMRQADGYTEKDMAIHVLASSLTGDITTDQRINVLEGPNAGIWMIESVVRDPSGIGWELRGRRG